MALESGNATLRQWEPQTIRAFRIRIGGRLVSGANQLRLKRAEPRVCPETWADWEALASRA